MKLLEHVTILDLSRVLACPFASMILAELGATVIKIEEPSHGDETRSFEPFVREERRDRERLLLRLQSQQAIGHRQPALGRRARTSSAISRATPTCFSRISRSARSRATGSTIRTSARVNERIVYVSCTGFGQSGPYAQRKGYDTIFQAMGGIMSLTGERGGPPVKPGLPFADLTSGPVDRDRDPGRPARARRERTRRPHRLLHARRPDRAADARRRALFRARRGAAAARHRASRPRALGELSVRRRRLSAHHRERPALAAALPRARARSLGQRRRAARATAGACGGATK